MNPAPFHKNRRRSRNTEDQTFVSGKRYPSGAAEKKQLLDKELLAHISNDWRTFRDILFAFNGARPLPLPQGEVQRAMDRLTRAKVLEKREAKTRLKFLADDMRLYRLNGKPKGRTHTDD